MKFHICTCTQMHARTYTAGLQFFSTQQSGAPGRRCGEAIWGGAAREARGDVRPEEHTQLHAVAKL